MGTDEKEASQVSTAKHHQLIANQYRYRYFVLRELVNPTTDIKLRFLYDTVRGGDHIVESEIDG